MSTVTTRVRCAVSGIVTGCRPDVYAKRLAKAGSVEALNATYVSSFAKRELRAGKTIEQIRSGLSAEARATLPAEASLADVIAKVVSKKAPKMSNSTSKDQTDRVGDLSSPFGEAVAKNWKKNKTIDADVANFVAAK